MGWVGLGPGFPKWEMEKGPSNTVRTRTKTAQITLADFKRVRKAGVVLHFSGWVGLGLVGVLLPEAGGGEIEQGLPWVAIRIRTKQCNPLGRL